MPSAQISVRKPTLILDQASLIHVRGLGGSLLRRREDEEQHDLVEGIQSQIFGEGASRVEAEHVFAHLHEQDERGDEPDHPVLVPLLREPHRPGEDLGQERRDNRGEEHRPRRAALLADDEEREKGREPERVEGCKKGVLHYWIACWT